jgi:hypothetical protein
MTAKLQRPEQLALDLTALQPEAASEPAAKPRQKAEKSVALIHRQANGVEIDQRDDDGYFDATAMCRAYGKQFNDYSRLDQTKDYLAALAADTGIPVTGLVESRRGGADRGGSWVHPEVAVDLAQWLSPQFKVRVNRWILEWMRGRQPTLHTAPTDRFVIGKMIDAVRVTADNAAAKADEALRKTTETQLDLWRHCSEVDSRLRNVEGQSKSPPKTGEPNPHDERTWRVRKRPAA